ncbi:PREDICTED: uncharacterized protein LOC106786089 [Polistes canadensis]|uniref:uncharacterized protein LOC106786089 n=1 Tax=Polistes canadensis TaxID=91411 RepID=UPI000718DE07|nr:PREDICTED: uncharacterized protein LOC106786089 [Polistes canadensis]
MAKKSKRFNKKLMRKHAKRKWQKPIRIAALIISAIKDLRETKGSTIKKIIDYIKRSSNLSEKNVSRQVNAALKRGVEYGIIRKYRGHYFLPMENEVDRANRIAVRFARLPSPKRGSRKSKNVAIRKTQTTRDRKKAKNRRRRRKKEQNLANISENSIAVSKKPRKSRSLPFSTTTTANMSLEEKTETDDNSSAE